MLGHDGPIRRATTLDARPSASTFHDRYTCLHTNVLLHETAQASQADHSGDVASCEMGRMPPVPLKDVPALCNVSHDLGEVDADSLSILELHIRCPNSRLDRDV
jgi:hypothetical protein